VQEVHVCLNKLNRKIAEMATYINYTRNLGFEEDPNYDYLRGLFRKILESNNQQYDFIFDWIVLGNNKTNIKQIVYLN